MIKVTLDSGASTDAIRRAIAELSDMTPVFRDVMEYMVEATRKRFIAGVAPDGSKWAPKRQSTLDRYKRLGYGSLARLKPLVGPGQRLSQDIVGQSSRQGALIGSALIYSGVMQQGASKGAFGKDRRGHFLPWGNIPARVWLGISSADEVAMVNIVEDRLGGVLDAAKPAP